MTLDFDFGDIRTTEFGIGRDADGRSAYFVSVDADVQKALIQMAEATWQAMQELSEAPSKYEPSEKYSGSEHIYLPLEDDLAVGMRELHRANNITSDATALSDPADIVFYFVRITDGQGRRLTALRRATQFKGVLKSRLIRFVSDALKIVEDDVFRLDNDFDLLVDNATVHVLRPSGFEFAGKLQAAVMAAVPGNVKAIQSDLPFVELSGIQNYAIRHPRAARYLASIRAQKETGNIDKESLATLCSATGVEILEADGKLAVADAHVMGFLEVLDRRRYEIRLVSGVPERFKAGSRQKIEN